MNVTTINCATPTSGKPAPAGAPDLKAMAAKLASNGGKKGASVADVLKGAKGDMPAGLKRASGTVAEVLKATTAALKDGKLKPEPVKNPPATKAPAKPAAKAELPDKLVKAAKVVAGTHGKGGKQERATALPENADQPRGAFTPEAIDKVSTLIKAGTTSGAIQKALRWNHKRVQRYMRTVAVGLQRLKLVSDGRGDETTYKAK